MPAFGTHMLIIEETIHKLISSRCPHLINVGHFLNDNINLARLGSIGPDLFYCTESKVKFVEKYIGKNLKFFLRDIKKLFDDIENVLEEGEECDIPGIGLACRIGEDFTNLIEASLTTAINTTITLLLETVEFIAITISSMTSPIGSPIHGLVDLAGGMSSDGHILHGRPESEWDWGNILHFQISGIYAKILFEEILNKDKLEENDLNENNKMLAYLMGFLSHIAGDITGHAYVNQVVGGPARNHAWRHRLCEMVLDKHLWNIAKGEDIALIELNKKIKINKEEREELANLLHKACEKVYSLRQTKEVWPGEIRPINSPPSKKDIVNYIKYLSSMLKLLHEFEMPYPDPPEVFTYSDAIEDFIDDVSEAFSDLRNLGDSDSVWDFFKGLAGALFSFAALGRKLGENLISSTISQGFAIPLSFLYITQLAIYYIYYAVKKLFALIGLLYPDNLLMLEPYAQQFLHGFWDKDYPCKRDVLYGINAYEALKSLSASVFQIAYNSSPTDTFEDIQNIENKVKDLISSYKPELKDKVIVIDRNPFEYPLSPIELPKSFSSPFINKPPTALLNGYFDLKEFYKYINFNNPNETDQYSNSMVNFLKNFYSKPLMGDPVGVTAAKLDFLFSNPDMSFIDWNIDSDRGYGYRFWLVPQNQNLLSFSPVNINGYTENPRS